MKVGERLIKAVFLVKPETANQWDRWVVKLESNLNIIIGAKGIVLLYIIREEENIWKMETSKCARPQKDGKCVYNVVMGAWHGKKSRT